MNLDSFSRTPSTFVRETRSWHLDGTQRYQRVLKGTQEARGAFGLAGSLIPPALAGRAHRARQVDKVQRGRAH